MENLRYSSDGQVYIGRWLAILEYAKHHPRTTNGTTPPPGSLVTPNQLETFLSWWKKWAASQDEDYQGSAEMWRAWEAEETVIEKYWGESGQAALPAQGWDEPIDSTKPAAQHSTPGINITPDSSSVNYQGNQMLHSPAAPPTISGPSTTYPPAALGLIPVSPRINPRLGSPPFNPATGLPRGAFEIWYDGIYPDISQKFELFVAHFPGYFVKYERIRAVGPYPSSFCFWVELDWETLGGDIPGRLALEHGIIQFMLRPHKVMDRLYDWYLQNQGEFYPPRSSVDIVLPTPPHSQAHPSSRHRHQTPSRPASTRGYRSSTSQCFTRSRASNHYRPYYRR